MRVREYGLMMIVAAGVSGCADTRHAQDNDACNGYGFKQGTKEHAHCMMTRDVERRRAVGAIMADRPNTSCTKNGDTVNCNSY